MQQHLLLLLLHSQLFLQRLQLPQQLIPVHVLRRRVWACWLGLQVPLLPLMAKVGKLHQRR
jgi:hypothetical protein